MPRLVRGNWEKLTELRLVQCGITDAGLHALAAADFTPNLEVLDLSDNRLDDGSGNWDGLRELAAAMNPGCLRLLNLTNTGLSGVPDFLGTPLGDRVTVGW
jgi:Ran GTPase-activating protein (RanGAP) involved in mRNA processing and transport